jgi:DNA (cytosine-5)-methyltransferase 1
VDYAVNHDDEAISMHRANHPNTEHLPCNIWQVEFDQLVAGRKVALMWFSPDCKHFSKAKGGKPVKKNIRDLAWVVVKAARQVRPKVIMLENVEEFHDWGPLMFKRMGDGKIVGDVTLFQAADGFRPAIPDDVVRDEKTNQPVLVPDPERKGQTFREWAAALRRLGYHMEWKRLKACDYGAPTIRTRFFMIARRDGKEIVWPEPTHGDPKSEAVKEGRLKPYRTAADIIDWQLPCPSIFLSREECDAWYRETGQRVKRPLAPATEDRVFKGLDRYLFKAEEPFIVNLTHQGSDRVEPISEPLNTVTGAHRGEKAICVPTVIQSGYGERDGQEPRVPGAENPLGTVVAGGVKHAVMSPTLIGVGGRAGQSPPRAGDMPINTLTAKADGAIVATTLVPSATYAQQGGGNRSVEEPVQTATASDGDQNQIIAPLLARVAHSERDKKGKKRGRGEQSVTEPLPTVMASPEFSVVAPHLTKFRANSVASGRRMNRSPRSPPTASSIAPAARRRSAWLLRT